LETQDKKFLEFEAKAFEAVNLVSSRIDELIKLKTEALLVEKLL
jgi:hypothetical protein